MGTRLMVSNAHKSAGTHAQSLRVVFWDRVTSRFLEQIQVNLHRLKRHKHRIFRCALHQTMLFELANVRVYVGIVACHGFGQGIDRTGAALAQRLQQVDACRREFREQRAGWLETQVVVGAE